MPAHFQLAKTRNGRFHFNLLASNGQVILSSQTYASKVTARKGIASVQANAARKSRYELRSGKGGQSHFVLKAANHRVIGASETYSSTAKLQQGLQSVMKNGGTRAVIDETA